MVWRLLFNYLDLGVGVLGHAELRTEEDSEKNLTALVSCYYIIIIITGSSSIYV